MLRNREEKRTAISAAIAEADRVGFISQESMGCFLGQGIRTPAA